MVIDTYYLLSAYCYLLLSVFIDERTTPYKQNYGAINKYIYGGISSNGLKANREWTICSR
jgi:hypothetical protein